MLAFFYCAMWRFGENSSHQRKNAGLFLALRGLMGSKCEVQGKRLKVKGQRLLVP
jgi:hypothetical protein